jgi:hypothetical protein
MEIKDFTPDIIQKNIDNKIEKIIIDENFNSPLPKLPDTIKINKLENKKADNSDNISISSFNSDISEESSSTDKLLKEIEELKKTYENTE